MSMCGVQVPMDTASALELARREEDMRDDRSIISMPEGWAPAEQPTIERPADAMAAKKTRAAAYAAQHPDRDHDERPLTENERRGLRRATHQLCTFRAPTTSKDTSSHRHAIALIVTLAETLHRAQRARCVFVCFGAARAGQRQRLLA